MTYLWIQGDKVITEPTREHAEMLYNVTREPDRVFTDDEWSSYNGLARIIDGALFLGKTTSEIKAEEKSQKEAEILELKQYLNSTDYVAAKLAEGYDREDYADELIKRKEARERINALEDEIKELS